MPARQLPRSIPELHSGRSTTVGCEKAGDQSCGIGSAIMQRAKTITKVSSRPSRRSTSKYFMLSSFRDALRPCRAGMEAELRLVRRRRESPYMSSISAHCSVSSHRPPRIAGLSAWGYVGLRRGERRRFHKAALQLVLITGGEVSKFHGKLVPMAPDHLRLLDSNRPGSS